MDVTFTQASGLQDSIYGNVQAPIQRFIEERGEEFERTSALELLFLMGSTTNFGDMLSSMTAMDGFDPVGELGEYPTDGMVEGFQKFLPQEVWKNSFSLSREIIEDSKIMDLRQKPAQFTTAYLRTRELFGASMFGAAMNGAKSMQFRGKSFDVSCADKEALFSKAHPSIVDEKFKQSNMFSNAFSKDSLNRVESAMQMLKGDNGEELGISPDTIVIPNDPDLKDEVFSVIGADKNPVNAENSFNYQYGRWNVIIWSYLNRFIKPGQKPWFLADDSYNKLFGGAVWNDRTKLEVRSSVNENNDANIWRGYARYAATFFDWRAFCGGGMAGGDLLKAA